MPHTPIELDLDTLSRWPDVTADNLQAVDATDRLLLDEAATAIEALGDGELVIIGDRYGALTLGAAARFGADGIRVQQDLLIGEQALRANAEIDGLQDRFTNLPLGAELLRGARVVLVQLPRQLAALTEIAEAVAAYAADDVRVFAGGRLKHMSASMNERLAACFGDVHASLARQKSRLLIASGPVRPAGDVDRFTRTEIADLGLTVASTGSTFAGASLDIGTRHLLSFLDEFPADAGVAIDLGCGTGLIAAAVAARLPEARVIATDISTDAVASATETARINGLADRIEVVRDVALSTQPDASADLILLNPPFHTGATVHAGLARELFTDAARVLRPGGQLWTVYNSHLGYRGSLTEIVGATVQRGQNPKFTVTRSTKA